MSTGNGSTTAAASIPPLPSADALSGIRTCETAATIARPPTCAEYRPRESPTQSVWSKESPTLP